MRPGPRDGLAAAHFTELLSREFTVFNRRLCGGGGSPWQAWQSHPCLSPFRWPVAHMAQCTAMRPAGASVTSRLGASAWSDMLHHLLCTIYQCSTPMAQVEADVLQVRRGRRRRRGGLGVETVSVGACSLFHNSRPTSGAHLCHIWQRCGPRPVQWQSRFLRCRIFATESTRASDGDGFTQLI